MEKINPEKAVHNIATTFCKKFLDASKDPSVLNPDHKALYDASVEAAKLYALVYDVAFETISAENS